MIDRNQIRKQVQHLRICDWAATLICVVSIALVLFAPQISKGYYLIPVSVAVGGFQWYRVIKNDDLKVACTCPHCHKRISPRRLLRENMMACPYCGKPIMEQKPEIDL